MRPVLAGLALLALVLPLAPPSAGADPAQTHVVEARNFIWTPDAITVAPGDSVRFVLGEGAHTWVSDAGMGSCGLPCTVTFPEEGSFPYHCGVHPGMRGVVAVGTPPAVVVDDPEPGASVQGTHRVRGTASHASSAIVAVHVRVDDGPFRAATLETTGLDVAWRHDLNTTGLANGVHRLTARATTALGTTGEATVEMVVDNPPFHDVRVSSLVPINGYPAAKVQFAVQNRGNEPASFRVSIEYLHQETWRPIASYDVETLAAGSTFGSTATWDGGGLVLGSFEIRAVADADDALPETDEANNERRGRVAFLHPLVPGTDLREPLA